MPSRPRGPAHQPDCPVSSGTNPVSRPGASLHRHKPPCLRAGTPAPSHSLSRRRGLTHSWTLSASPLLDCGPCRARPSLSPAPPGSRHDLQPACMATVTGRWDWCPLLPAQPRGRESPPPASRAGAAHPDARPLHPKLTPARPAEGQPLCGWPPREDTVSPRVPFPKCALGNQSPLSGVRSGNKTAWRKCRTE